MIYGKENKELEKYLKILFKEEYLNFLNTSPEPTAIRVNSIKSNFKDFIQKLDGWKQKHGLLKFQPTTLILDKDEIPLSHTLEYFCGNFFYQGISSQLPVELLNIRPGDKVLDMAAAPGSKSCQILNKLNHKGFLVSNDSSRKRIQPLNINIQRTGAANHYILNTWGEQLGLYYTEYFDKVLLDAPCTALGTLASSNEVVNWWSKAKLNKLGKSQYALLVAGLKALKVGGELVYSTCSVAPEENEVIIQKALDNYHVEIVNDNSNLNDNFDNGYQFYNNFQFSEKMLNAIRVFPHKHGYEGFFAIKLRKRDSIKSIKQTKEFKTKKLCSWNQPEVVDILKSISEKWGIEETFWQKYKYNLTKNRIWIAGEITEIPSENFVCCGILLAEKKISGWKLFNNSVTFLNSKIKNRIIEFDDEKLKLLFKYSVIENENIDNGYFVLARNKNPIASLYVNNGKVKIRLPHLFNLVID